MTLVVWSSVSHSNGETGRFPLNNRKDAYTLEMPNPRTIYLMGVMHLMFTAHHIQQRVPTECEHTSGKGSSDTDKVLRERAWIILGLQVGVSTYIWVNKVITVRLWYCL